MCTALATCFGCQEVSYTFSIMLESNSLKPGAKISLPFLNSFKDCGDSGGKQRVSLVHSSFFFFLTAPPPSIKFISSKLTLWSPWSASLSNVTFAKPALFIHSTQGCLIISTRFLFSDHSSPDLSSLAVVNRT